jgi:copper transport protein
VAAGESSAARKLGRNAAIECAIVLGVLALVATWRFTPPPRALAVPAAVSIHLHGEKAMAQLDIAPRREGGAQVDMQVLDGELRPLSVKEVTLVIANPTAGIEPIRRNAVRSGEVNWRIDNLVIPIAGRWQVRVDLLISDFERITLEDAAALPHTP